LHAKEYRPDIDGLRAIAVGSVVAFHAFPKLLPGGFTGVDIFFVISGYLISDILLAEIVEGRFSILRFYQRRTRRIFPALVVVMLATLLLGWAFLLNPEFWRLGCHIAASSLFTENFLLWSEAGYFDAASHEKPLLHLWSLAVEEQFYIFWPILLYGAWRLVGRTSWLLVIILVPSLLLSVHDAAVDPAAAFYSPLSRFWELMIGAGLAELRRSRLHFPAALREAQSWTGAALLVLALVLIDEHRPFPGLWALLPTLGAALLIAAGDECWINRRLLATPPMVFVGTISYPLYLWHWPLFSYAFLVRGSLTPRLALGLVALAIALATATYLVVEKPIRFGAWRRVRPIEILAAMCVVLAIGASVSLLQAPPRLAAVAVPMRHEWEYLLGLSGNTDPDSVGIYRLSDQRPGLALFTGDSQVAQYAERVGKTIAADPGNLGAVFAIGGGCVPITDVFNDSPLRRGCWELRREAAAIAAEDRVKAVVIGGSWNWYFFDELYYVRAADKSLPLTTTAGRDAALRQLEQQIAALVQAKKQVFLLLGNPIHGQLNPFRLDRLAAPGEARPRRTPPLDPAQAQLRQELIDVARRAGATTIDPYPILCPQGICTAMDVDGQPIFKDASHFNPDWALAHAGFIDPAVEPLPATRPMAGQARTAN
jgi:peptidoglycan/LPS O-acetylase OafA/YrhL